MTLTNITLNATDIISRLNQTNITVDTGNFTVNVSSLMNSSINISGSLIKNITDQNAIVEVNLIPLINQLIDYGAIPTNFSVKYQVIEGFDQPNGKFSNSLGNVAIIDCHSVGFAFSTFYQDILDNL